MEKLKEFGELVEFLIDSTNALVNGLQINDMEVLMHAPEAFMGIGEIIDEINGCSPEEIREEIEPIIRKLDLPDDDFEASVEDSILMVISWGRIVARKLKATK